MSTLVRRAFLGTAALPAAMYARVLGANERVGLGLIGFGLIAQTHVATFRKLADAEFTAVSDCHRKRLSQGVETVGGRASPYPDFRKLLDDKAVDAVLIATPDHWHALMTMLACTAGKDVYVEKPLTLFVREGEWMQRVAERTKRVVQVGTQQRSGSHYQEARDLIRSGRLGTITSVRMSSIRNITPGFGQPPDSTPPVDLDWEMWLGPTPTTPFNPLRGLYHFRWFWQTSGGQMTNLGAHHLDILDWILGLQSLQSVMSVGGRYALRGGGETPDTQDALFDLGRFSAAITIREAAVGERPERGLTFYGTRGSLSINRSGFDITPDLDTPSANQIPGVKSGHPADGPVPVAVGEPKPRTEARKDDTGSSPKQYLGHARNFLDCIRSRQTPISDLASAQRTAIACHLANLSLQLGRSLRWDSAANRVIGDDEANRRLERPYRSPWDRELKALNVGT